MEEIWFEIELREKIAKEKNPDEMPLSRSVCETLFRIILRVVYGYNLNFGHPMMFLKHDETNWLEMCEEESDYVSEVARLAMTPEFYKRKRHTHTLVGWFLDNMYFPYFDMYEDMCFQRFDIENRKRAWFEPKAAPLMVINDEIIYDRWVIGRLFNPQVVSFFCVDFCDSVENLYTAYLWRKEIFLFPDLIESTTGLEPEEEPPEFEFLYPDWVAKVPERQTIWPIFVNISPYHFVNNVLRIWKDKKNYHRVYVSDRSKINWLLVPNLFKYDWPLAKPVLEKKYIFGRQVRYFYDELIFFPKTYFPLTNFQIDYAVRHYMLQLLEQVYFERWRRYYDKGILKTDVYYDTFNKVRFFWWPMNRITIKTWFKNHRLGWLESGPILIDYTIKELTRAMLYFFVSGLSSWWLKSLYTKRMLAFKLKWFHFPWLRALHRDLPILKFIYVYLAYSSQFLLQGRTRMQEKKYGYLYRDNFMWLLFKFSERGQTLPVGFKWVKQFKRGKIKKNQLRAYSGDKVATPIQEEFLKRFFFNLIPRVYIEDHFFMFQNIQEELFRFMKDKRFLSLKQRHRPSIEALYGFIINYYTAQFRFFLFADEHKHLIWNGNFYRNRRILTYFKYSKLSLFYIYVWFVLRLIHEHKYRITSFPELWESIILTTYVGKYFEPNINAPTRYYNWEDRFNMVDWEIQELNFKFQSDRYINLIFNKLEYVNLCWHRYNFLYHPELNIHPSPKRTEPNPFEPVIEYSHGRVRVRYRAFNYKYFADVRDQRILIRFYLENLRQLKQLERRLFKKTIFKKTSKQDKLNHLTLMLNTFGALYHIERHGYLLHLEKIRAKLTELPQTAEVRALKKKSLIRSYSSLFGWENWKRDCDKTFGHIISTKRVSAIDTF